MDFGDVRVNIINSHSTNSQRSSRTEGLNESMVCEISNFCALQRNYVGNGAQYDLSYCCLLVEYRIRFFRLVRKEQCA